ncbi:hypothetical protein IGI73_003350 [Enterococcus sp. DIV0755f]|uniref:PIN-like domain-containing protein n=1 Tax=Enterococcus sp. DIV0755f TaxID=2774665 RepID=UPI003F25B54E
MKDKFKVFYENEILDFDNLDRSVVIVLDANVLLHFFRYSKKSQDKLFLALEKVRSNLFIPYQAALEYHYERQNVSRSNKKKIEKMISESEIVKNNFQDEVIKQIEEYGGTIRSTDEKTIREEVVSEFENATNQFWKSFKEISLKKLMELIPDNSRTAYQIADLLDNKVGEPFSSEEIQSISEEGEKRYALELPPGYKDSKKKNKMRIFGEYTYDMQYGDLILWKEIIKYCEKNTFIRTVIFISDDEKNDWIFKAKGEKVGVRVELKQELNELVDARLEVFSPKKFLDLITKEEGIIKESSRVSSNSKSRTIFFRKTKRRIRRLHALRREIDELRDERNLTEKSKEYDSKIASEIMSLNEIFKDDYFEFAKFASNLISTYDNSNDELVNLLSHQYNMIEQDFLDYDSLLYLDDLHYNIRKVTSIINSCKKFADFFQ